MGPTEDWVTQRSSKRSCLVVQCYVMLSDVFIQWNFDFSNLHGKRKLVREIGKSKFHCIMNRSEECVTFTHVKYQNVTVVQRLQMIVSCKAKSRYRLHLFQRERVLKKRMKEKKRAKQKMTNAEHKVRVATAFRGNKESDLELQVGDEVTVFIKVRLYDLVYQTRETVFHPIL